MDYILIPHTNFKLYDGSVVILSRFPDTRWIVHNGFYSFNGTQANGWYFESIPAGTIMPLTEPDLEGIYVVSSPSGGCPHPKPWPGPGPFPPVPGPGPKSIDIYRSGINYKKGQVLYLTPGELYQATEDFLSSYSEPSESENLDKDVALGHLIGFPSDADIASKMELQEDAQSGHIAVFEDSGQVIDSGQSIDDVRPKWVDLD